MEGQMRTLTEVTKQAQYPRLVRAVIRKIGLDSIEDVNNHGVDGGFNGFIYHRDTISFFKRHRKDILALAQESADSMGVGMLEMIQGFNCVGKDYSIEEIGQAVYSGKGEASTTIKNALAWFAAEEVCRMFED